jgi:hypothetical protein
MDISGYFPFSARRQPNAYWDESDVNDLVSTALIHGIGDAYVSKCGWIGNK